MAPAVLIENLQKRYGSVEAVKDVSLQVEPGTIFGLLGPNGAGKTTTIRCLCTLTTPDAGRIEVELQWRRDKRGGMPSSRMVTSRHFRIPRRLANRYGASAVPIVPTSCRTQAAQLLLS